MVGGGRGVRHDRVGVGLEVGVRVRSVRSVTCVRRRRSVRIGKKVRLLQKVLHVGELLKLESRVALFKQYRWFTSTVRMYECMGWEGLDAGEEDGERDGRVEFAGSAGGGGKGAGLLGSSSV